MDIINIKANRITLILASLLITLGINSQPPKNLAEQVGYPKDSKLLIIHADDMGLMITAHPGARMTWTLF
jgi:hypothetical protein